MIPLEKLKVDWMYESSQQTISTDIWNGLFTKGIVNFGPLNMTRCRTVKMITAAARNCERESTDREA